MPHDPAAHHRRSIRLQGYDYTQSGVYFVTVVTYGRMCWFGKLDGDVICFSQAGQVAEGEWQRLERRFPGVMVDEFTIMPNHIHGIIHLPDVFRATQSPLPPTSPLPPSPMPHGPRAGELGTIVGAYKSTTARLMNGINHTPGAPFWQRNYYEHIIRSEEDLDRIRVYIQDNPRRWAEDKENIWK